MNLNRKSTLAGTALTVALALLMAGCSGQPLSEREKGTLAGGVLGAGTGAIIGSAVGNPAAGAAIGGGLGALGGAAVGNELQNQQVRSQEEETALQKQQQELEANRRELERLRQERATQMEARPPVYRSEARPESSFSSESETIEEDTTVH